MLMMSIQDGIGKHGPTICEPHTMDIPYHSFKTRLTLLLERVLGG